MSDGSIIGKEPAGSAQYLTFFLDGEEYGVDILRVQGIQGWDRATQIPNAPEYVLGVINLRGAVVPIIDLRMRFGLEPASFGPTTVVVVVKIRVGVHDRVVGLVVDAVSDVYGIQAEDRRPAPDLGSQGNSAFIAGLATVDKKMLILLDADALMGEATVALPEVA
jgi:purine-binding chemotaxis protein CheW